MDNEARYVLRIPEIIATLYGDHKIHIPDIPQPPSKKRKFRFLLLRGFWLVDSILSLLFSKLNFLNTSKGGISD